MRGRTHRDGKTRERVRERGRWSNGAAKRAGERGRQRGIGSCQDRERTEGREHKRQRNARKDTADDTGGT